MTTIQSAMATFRTQNDRKPFQANAPLSVNPAKQAGMSAIAIATLKSATQRGKTGRACTSKEIATAKKMHNAMRKGTPHVNVIHARSLHIWVISGARSGRKAAMSQKTVAVRNAIGAAPATPITQ